MSPARLRAGHAGNTRVMRNCSWHLARSRIFRCAPLRSVASRCAEWSGALGPAFKCARSADWYRLENVFRVVFFISFHDRGKPESDRQG